MVAGSRWSERVRCVASRISATPIAHSGLVGSSNGVPHGSQSFLSKHSDLIRKSIRHLTGARRIDQRGYASEASRMLSIATFRAASNSSLLWYTDSPSVRAREKLAITPWLADRRSSASSRP